MAHTGFALYGAASRFIYVQISKLIRLSSQYRGLKIHIRATLSNTKTVQLNIRNA